MAAAQSGSDSHNSLSRLWGTLHSLRAAKSSFLKPDGHDSSSVWMIRWFVSQSGGFWWPQTNTGPFAVVSTTVGHGGLFCVAGGDGFIASTELDGTPVAVGNFCFAQCQ